MDLNELAKQPETVLALMEGEFLFQFENEKMKEPGEQILDSVPVLEKVLQSIPLIILVFLKDGGTVPEEQRVFLRKMIKATEIPGSQMKYVEIQTFEEFQKLQNEWIPNRWIMFGWEYEEQTILKEDEKWKQGMVCPPMEMVWNDISQKQVLWNLMQGYFELKKK